MQFNKTNREKKIDASENMPGMFHGNLLTRGAFFSGHSWGACPQRGIAHKSVASSNRTSLLMRSDGTAFAASSARMPGT